MLDVTTGSFDQVNAGILSAINLSGSRNKMILETVPCRSESANSVLDLKTFADHPVIIISHGTVGLQHVLKDGRRSISTIFLPGELLDFRHMKMNDGTLICLSAVEMCLFEADVFDRLQQDSPMVRAALVAAHFRHCGFTASHCVDLSRKSAVEKLASFIFECRSRQLAVRDNRVSLLLKRIDIADYMGLRPETLSRAFAKLKQNKLIAFDDIDHIRILNEPVLRQIANGAAMETGCAA